MESHRLSGSPDVRIQRGNMLHGSTGSQDSLFGVKVQIQGIQGQPYVVLNSSGHERHKDISVITHQAGYNPGMVRRSADERQTPFETERPANSSVFHYQKHPEILRPYDPESNNLNLITPSQTASPSRPGQPYSGLRSETTSSSTAKPRIPLPAESPVVDPAEETQDKSPASGGHVPAQSPNSVDTDSIMSVGRLISQFNSNLRRGRGPRNRLDKEASRRSRSVDNRRTSDSSSTSSSQRASSLRGIRGETQSGIYPPGSARARLLGGEAPLISKGEESKPSALSKETVSHPVTKVPPRAEKLSAPRTYRDQSGESEERDMQVNHFWFGAKLSF